MQENKKKSRNVNFMKICVCVCVCRRIWWILYFSHALFSFCLCTVCVLGIKRSVARCYSGRTHLVKRWEPTCISRDLWHICRKSAFYIHNVHILYSHECNASNGSYQRWSCSAQNNNLEPVLCVWVRQHECPSYSDYFLSKKPWSIHYLP